MSYRIKVSEKDLSGFVTTQVSEIGSAVVRSRWGKADKPILCFSEQDVLLYFGKPDATYYGIFEAIQFSRVSPIWLVSAIGANSLYGGLDVKTSSVESFGTRTGRASYSTVDYTLIPNNASNELVGTGDGLIKSFTGTLSNTSLVEGKLQIKLGTTTIASADSGGNIIGTDIDGTGTIDYNTGAYSFVLNGVSGTVASYTTAVDLVADVDLSTIASAGYDEVSFSTPLVGTIVPAIASDTYSLNIDLDSGGATEVTFAILISDTWTEIVTKLNTALTGMTAIISSGRLRITSDSTGSASTLVLIDGSTGTGGGFLSACSSVSYTPTLEDAVDGVNVGIKITIDGVDFDNIDIGASATTTRASIITAINNAVGSTVASINNSGGTFIDISGLIASTTTGEVIIDSPSNLQDGFSATIAPTAPVYQGTSSVSPTGAVPINGQNVFVDYVYTLDLSSTISHSFFAMSQYSEDDLQLAMKIENTTGSKYNYSIYEVKPVGNVLVEEGVYSLLREQDSFGKSLYIGDVFNDQHPYVIPVVNTDYVGVASPSVNTVNFSGGSRGEAPLLSDYVSSWSFFNKANKYPTKILQDYYGTMATTIQSVISNYQPYAFGITCVPLGNNATEAITFRQSLGIDFDGLALYTNWAKIVDTYNSSSAWTSNVGKIAVQYALMEDIFDGLAPAGVNENGHGGQLSGFQVLEVEEDYSDTEMKNMDLAQINPVIFDDQYGLIIEGDKTMQVNLSDTSFIGHRRVDNIIIENIKKQVLRKQVFKLNDEFHRAKAKAQAEAIIRPIKAEGLIRSARVVCDETNNSDSVLASRKFILDVYRKITPTSEEVGLRFTRVSQTEVLVDTL